MELEISLLAIFVSIISIIVSWITRRHTNQIANDDFNLKHRTFIQFKDFAYPQDEKFVRHPDQIQLFVFNNPAKLISEKYEVLAGITVLERMDYSDGKIIFPTTQPAYIIRFEQFRNRLNMKSPNEKIYYRNVEIQYKSLNSKLTYKYVSKEKFNPQTNSWDLIEEDSN